MASKYAKQVLQLKIRNLVKFDNRLVEIEINLNVGPYSATILTNDLTHDYVHENSAYAT
jgi:glutamate N-acetyltransferase/amino-acid N-acetyltransferase